MYTKQKAALDVVKALKKSIGKSFTVSVDMLEDPPKKELGDFAFPCFELAKGAKRNPKEIATELAAKIAPTDLIDKIVALGPYVNFYLKNEAVTESVLKEISVAKEKYGNGTSGNGREIFVEGMSPNTHKEFHIGHIRNTSLPQSLARVLRANGYKVVLGAYIGDIGAHVAKALWGMKKFHDGEKFEKATRAAKLGEIYTEATRYVDEHPEAKEEIADVQRKLEAEEEPWYSLWKETREWSLDSFRSIYKEFDVQPDVWYYESDVEEEGKEMVKRLLTEGVAKKSEGATVIDLEDEGLGVFLILKSDGSSLYATKDIALAFRRQRDYDPDRQILLVDARQSFYFKQLFAALKRMGFSAELKHFAFEMVTLPDGAMSSRQGNIVRYETFRDEMMAKFAQETRLRHEDWSEKKVKEVARVLTMASISFTMLRQDPESVITFDMEEAMSFDGYTAPYILYTVARISSIERQAKKKAKVNAALLTHPTEQELVRALMEFPVVVQRASATFQVSSIAMWAFEVSKLFAEYYHQVKILNEEEADKIPARLALIGAVRTSLENAMDLLGIDTLDEM